MSDMYVKLSGKKRVDTKTYTREQISAPSFTDDYGRLINCGYVVFDFDEQPYIDIISKIVETSNLKCKKLITTRGVHYMFRTTLNNIKNKSHEFNWLGLQCDIKGIGRQEQGKTAYQAIKVKGEIRKEEFIHCSSDDELDIAPRWLYHIPKKKDQQDLTLDQEGHRNDLFHSELMIKAKFYGFSYDEYVQMAHIINKYVLPKGLDENELNTAIRREEWDNLEFNKEKQLLFDMAEDVISTWSCVWVNEQIAFYNYNTERYSTNEIILMAYLQEKYSEKNMRTSTMKEVLEQVRIQLQNNSNYWRERNKEYILCNNELVSMNKDEVIPNTRTIFTDIYYPYSIMSKEEFDNFNGRTKSFMDEISCGNKETLQIIWECIGCMLAPYKPFGKIFIWYGSGSNGKSLLIKLINQIMGPLITYANILAINDRFALESVINGIANVTDDVGITTLKETGLLKSIIQGSSIEIRQKFKNSIWWQPNSQFVMCCNDIPRISDTTPRNDKKISIYSF